MLVFPSAKIYFGITSSPLRHRVGSHISWAKHNNDNRPITLALRKYGRDFDAFTLLDGLTKRQAMKAEQEHIAEYRTNCWRYGREFGYNADDGGNTGNGAGAKKGVEHKLLPVDEIVAMYANKVSLVDIGLHFGNIDHRTIKSRLIKAGVNIRPNAFTAGGVRSPAHAAKRLAADADRNRAFVRRCERRLKLGWTWKRIADAEGMSSRSQGHERYYRWKDRV